jgi:SAM-dependent methyltransferase
MTTPTPLRPPTPTTPGAPATPAAPTTPGGDRVTGTDPRLARRFDNDSAEAAEQLRCLSEALDPFTTARLAEAGAGAGWECLEVGAGNGSVAVWLAARAAPGGRVLATDLKPQHIPAAPGLEAVRHDVVRDPLPEGRFDLVHARLLLAHLPERQAVLRKLAAALRPGGVLQLDEFDMGYQPLLLAPDRESAELYEEFNAARARVLAAAGADVTWGRRCAEAMRDAGLVDVDPVPLVLPWHADAPGVRFLRHHTHQLRDALLAAGMTDERLARVRELLAHPEFRAVSYVVHSVQGRRPC